ncbi:hypothetical protein MPSEU_000595700 [Mayamaea pseudoterrestris]|nr:hypothetical protein MPSEU_000595700 [Mayamaea pseudoterrestris]
MNAFGRSVAREVQDAVEHSAHNFGTCSNSFDCSSLNRWSSFIGKALQEEPHDSSASPKAQGVVDCCLNYTSCFNPCGLDALIRAAGIHSFAPLMLNCYYTQLRRYFAR